MVSGKPTTWGVILGFTLLLTVVTFPLVAQMPAGLIPDDGYFYAGIARHIAFDHFSSFDGLHPTDGYHQLWQYLIAAVAWVEQPLHPSRVVLLQSFLFVDYLLLCTTAWLAGRNTLERTFVFLGLAGCEFLMEGHLLACLVALVAIALLNKRSSTAVFAAVALIPLARIDASVIPLGICLGLALGAEKRLATKILASTLIGVALHFGLMLVIHHHLATVSSEIKSGAASNGLRLFANLGQRTPTLPIPLEPQGASVVLFAIASVFALHGVPKSRQKSVLIGLWLGTACFTFVHLCLSDVHPWYYAPAFIGFPIVLIWSHEPKPKDPVILAGAALTFILIAAFVAKTFSNRKEAGPVHDFVVRLNATVPPTEPIYMIDGSGFMGYYSEAPIINGDGLVNSHDYIRRVKKNQLAGYLAENQIHYILSNQILSPGQPLVNFGGLLVSQDQAVRVLTKLDNGHYFFTNFVLWKIK